MKKLLLAVIALLASFAVAQNTPTSAPQFNVNMNFLEGTPYGQNAALSAAFTDQFTANVQLRGDVITMPGAGYTGYFGGAQGTIPELCTLLETTSLNCGKAQFLFGGSVGMGRVQQGSSPTTQSLAGLVHADANYDPTGSGKFTLNLFEVGWGHFGSGANGWYAQTGFSLGLGNNAAATQLKQARIRRSQAKKLKKLQQAIDKANKQSV